MRKTSALLALSIIAGVAAPAVAAAAKHRTRTAAKSATKHAARTKFVPHQRSIDDARATEIQQALIRAGYMIGEPSGHWDAASIAAMTKLQAANGWQTKLVPDSRALIKLGLGPSAAPATDSQAAPSSNTASIGAPASTAYSR